MSNNGQEERSRPRSFRIDDILATTTTTNTETRPVTTSSAVTTEARYDASTSTPRNLPVNVLPLRFGVDALLSSRPMTDLSSSAARYGEYSDKPLCFNLGLRNIFSFDASVFAKTESTFLCTKS